MHLIDRVSKKIGLEHARWTRERAKAARTFRTTKIAGGGRFNREGEGISPMDGPLEKPTQPVAAPEEQEIPGPSESQFGKKIQCITPVQSTHGLKIVLDNMYIEYK